MQTVVPGHDGAFYLWAAERSASGDPLAVFSILFQPLFSLLVGVVVALGVGGVLAGQIVSCGLGALAVLPLFAMSQSLVSRRAAHLACALYAFGLWFCRHPAACLSEGPFYLFVLTTACWMVQGQPLRAGLMAACAYATRPEGLLLLLLSMLRGKSGALRFMLGLLALAWLVPLGFWLAGHGFVLTSKSEFVWQEGIGGVARAEGVLAAGVQYLENVGRNIGVSFEAVGYLVLPLAVLGLCTNRRHELRLFCIIFVVQLLLVSMLRSHVRFLSGYSVLLLPLAAAGLERLWPSRSWLGIAALLLVLAPDLARLPRAVNQQRAVLLPLAQWLRPQLQGESALATDMVRLEYFCGQRPWLPRRIGAAEFLQRCGDPGRRIVVFSSRRGQLQPADLEALGFKQVQPPASLKAGLQRRGMLIYRR